MTATCVAGGSGPFKYEWLKDGSVIAKDLVNVVSGDEMSTILFRSISASHSGNYTCVAHNSFGSDRFTARLSVQCESAVFPL